MPSLTWFSRPLWASVAMAGLAACTPGFPDGPPVDPPPEPSIPTPPVPGATEFLSADGYSGERTAEDDAVAAPGAAADAEAGGDSERTVEEGDIYRVLEGGLLANLNAYRGLQLVDLSDPANPAIVGRLPVTGTPVEMYVRDQIAYLLLNDWRSYAGSRFASAVQRYEGGVALAVDVSDPTDPVVRGRALIPGQIRKSRLVHGGESAALYVVTGGYDQWRNEDGTWDWETRTVVKSFDVSAGDFVAKTELNLGGYVADIQATPEALLVARNDWNTPGGSRVSIVDISDPLGVMVEGADVQVAGRVETQFNMDLYRGVLRVVSGSGWGTGERVNHLQTFDAGDIQELTLLDHDTFGENEDLYATLFLGNKAFFVTYFRTDPFHAFEIDDDGQASERSEFIVSGWNDYFRAVFDAQRLIGIGVNDEQGRTMAVSLYDITDLENPRPLLQRAEVAADSSWSEASYDHRAFSVVENAVAVASGEVTETGLVLLPFSGWSEAESTYTTGVQIFTFSESTLTRRGLMKHGTQVRRSFPADEDVTANLSEAELSLFDASAPDAPVELGRVELAPNYTDVFVLDEDYAVRVTDPTEYYWGWWGPGAELPPQKAEIVRRDGDIDAAPALATIEFPHQATAFLTGRTLITVEPVQVEEDGESRTEGRAVLYDLSDPTVPVETATLQDARLAPQARYDFGAVADCWACGGYGAPQVEGYVLPGALALPAYEGHQEVLGQERSCFRYPNEPERCDDADGSCVTYRGAVQCASLDGGAERCTGEIRKCTTTEVREEDAAANGDDVEAALATTTSCEPVDPADLRLSEECYEGPRYRYWTSYQVNVLHIDEPTAPRLATTIELPQQHDAVGVVEAGETLWITTREPVLLETDPRPYQRYYAHPLRIDGAGEAVLASGINIPGVLIAAEGDTLYTQDLLWGEEVAESWVHRLKVREDVAELIASRSFAGRQVSEVRLDGAGHLLVSHRPSYAYGYPVDVAVGAAEDVSSSDAAMEAEQEMQQLAVLDAAAELDLLVEVAVDVWATLQDARRGRAVFQVPGGVLLMNLSDVSQPYPQAYFPTRGWPREILVDDDQVLFAAGRYGLYRFDLDAFNLLPSDLF